MLIEELRTKLTEEQISFLDKPFIYSTQLVALVENLFSVSLIERELLQVQVNVVAWEPLVEEVYKNFLAQAAERKIRLMFVKLTKKLPLVLVDKFKVSEVISNLLDNALNYTPSGGSVEINLFISNEVVIHIRDTGPDIPKSTIPGFSPSSLES